MSDTQTTNTPPKAGSGGGNRRPRRPPRAVTVERVEKVTPHMTRIIFGGEELAEFGPPRPGSHMKLLFVPECEEWSPNNTEAPRPPSRTYTPRRYDPERRELEVEFVHHGNGVAATWAETAKAGDPMFLAGPGGGYDVPEDATLRILYWLPTIRPCRLWRQSSRLCPLPARRQFLARYMTPKRRGARISRRHLSPADSSPYRPIGSAAAPPTPAPAACWRRPSGR